MQRHLRPGFVRTLRISLSRRTWPEHGAKARGISGASYQRDDGTISASAGRPRTIPPDLLRRADNVEQGCPMRTPQRTFRGCGLCLQCGPERQHAYYHPNTWPHRDGERNVRDIVTSLPSCASRSATPTHVTLPSCAAKRCSMSLPRPDAVLGCALCHSTSLTPPHPS